MANNSRYKVGLQTRAIYQTPRSTASKLRKFFHLPFAILVSYTCEVLWIEPRTYTSNKVPLALEAHPMYWDSVVAANKYLVFDLPALIAKLDDDTTPHFSPSIRAYVWPCRGDRHKFSSNCYRPERKREGCRQPSSEAASILNPLHESIYQTVRWTRARIYEFVARLISVRRIERRGRCFAHAHQKHQHHKSECLDTTDTRMEDTETDRLLRDS